MEKNELKKPKDFIEFYEELKFSPKQEISDYENHVKKRKELYKHLGLLPQYFKGKKIIEVGPAGGFNSLVIADLQPSEYYLIEPNRQGVKNINDNFNNHRLLKEGKLKIIERKIEDFNSNNKFDIVICEATVHGLKNQTEVLNKLDELLAPGGVLIITCIDEISYFFDIIKKYFAYELSKDIPTLEEKIMILSKAFNSHLLGNKVKRDWIIDNLLSDVIFNSFSIKDCINFYNEKYQIYNTSPKIFTDFRWYKKIPEDRDYNEIVIEQFDKIRHNLFYCYSILDKRTKKENDELIVICKEIKKLVYNSIINKQNNKKEIEINMRKLFTNLSNTNNEILNSLDEIIQLLQIKKLDIEDLNSKYTGFIKSFGRALQYVSLIKR